MPRAPYGKKCRKDVKAIRDILRTKMPQWAEEWAKMHAYTIKRGQKFARWRSFLADKLREEIQKLPITCD